MLTESSVLHKIKTKAILKMLRLQLRLENNQLKILSAYTKVLLSLESKGDVALISPDAIWTTKPCFRAWRCWTGSACNIFYFRAEYREEKLPEG